MGRANGQCMVPDKNVADPCPQRLGVAAEAAAGRGAGLHAQQPGYAALNGGPRRAVGGDPTAYAGETLPAEGARRRSRGMRQMLAKRPVAGCLGSRLGPTSA